MSETIDDLTRFDDNLSKNFFVKSKLKNVERKGIASMFSIKYVQRGVESYFIGGRVRRVPTQNFILTNPNQRTEIHVDTTSIADGVCFFFDTELIQQIAFSYIHSPVNQLDKKGLDHSFLLDENCLDSVFNIAVQSNNTQLHHLLRKIDQHNLNIDQRTEFLLQLGEALVAHHYETCKQYRKLAVVKTSTRVEHYSRLQKARQFMHDNLANDISLKDIAKAGMLSEYYFHRSFRSFFKMTPHQYLQNIRLQKAQNYLEKDYSKREIAQLCGFNETKYFTQVLKKWNQKNMK